MTIDQYEKKGYTKAEVEILLKLERMDAQIETVAENYVRKQEFDPVQRLVYGLVGLVLVAVIGSLVALVII